MTTDQYIRVVNWARFQHYKHRNPPWIKLHRELLTSRAWISGDDAQRALMVALMLIAADTDNLIPADPSYIQRRAYLNTEPDFSRLIDMGFIESASNVLASCTQDARPEIETETETEKTKPPRISKTLRSTTTPKPTAKPAVAVYRQVPSRCDADRPQPNANPASKPFQGPDPDARCRNCGRLGAFHMASQGDLCGNCIGRAPAPAATPPSAADSPTLRTQAPVSVST